MRHRVLTAIAAAGAGLLGYSLSLQPFTNVPTFMARYSDLYYGKEAQFYQLHDQFATAKYTLQDIGITLILMSATVALFYWLGRGQIRTPHSKLRFVLWAIFLPILTAGAGLLHEYIAVRRLDVPEWSNTWILALIVAPVLCTVFLIFSLLHLLFLRKISLQSLPVDFNFHQNKWLLTTIITTALLSVLPGLFGRYDYAVPGLLWIYFYASLATARQAAKDSETYRDYSSQTFEDRPLVQQRALGQDRSSNHPIIH